MKCQHCGCIIENNRIGVDTSSRTGNKRGTGGARHYHVDCGGDIEDCRPRKVREVVRNRHRHDREEVYDDGDQVLNDNLTEGLTTGAIAAPSAALNTTHNNYGRRNQGDAMTKSNKMSQSGKALGGRNVTKDKTGANDTKMREHGSPFKYKQKNTGGQFEKATGGVTGSGATNEGMSPAEIANTISDDGYTIQGLFNNYARSVNYVAIREFNEIARAYGCACHDEGSFMKLMEANQEFMFIEGQDNQGRYWVPQVMNENVANFGGKQAKPFGGKGKSNADDDSDIRLLGPDEEVPEKPKKNASGASKKPWERDDETSTPSEDEAREMSALVESVTGRPQGKKLQNGRRMPINERVNRPIREAGFQEYSPDEMNQRFKDPGYGDASSIDDMPWFGGNDLEDDLEDDDYPVGGNFDADQERAPAIDGSPMRSSDTMGNFDDNNYGGAMCPECNIPMDELGCKECGYVDEPGGGIEDPGYGPDELAAGREFAGAMKTSGGPFSRQASGRHDDIDDFMDAEIGAGGPAGTSRPGKSPYSDFDSDDYNSDSYSQFNSDFDDDEDFTERPFESRRRHGRRIAESDGTVMDGPTGNGVERHPGKSGGKSSGLPQTNTKMKDMGKEWPRQHKNTGSAQEQFGNSEHGEPGSIEGHKEMGSPFGRKQKNTGGQWERATGGGSSKMSNKMSGGADKMQEGVNLLGRHVRRMLSEYARNGNISSRNGRYPMRFVVSAGDDVRPKMHNRLAEALADAEELVQVFGPESVSFEAQFCRPDGSVAMKRLVPMINVPRRGPIVQEGGNVLFRFPEVAREFANAVVGEGKVCRAVTHNWGAAVSSRVSNRDATRIFRTIAESTRR